MLYCKGWSDGGNAMVDVASGYTIEWMIENGYAIGRKDKNNEWVLFKCDPAAAAIAKKRLKVK